MLKNGNQASLLLKLSLHIWTSQMPQTSSWQYHYNLEQKQFWCNPYQLRTKQNEAITINSEQTPTTQANYDQR